MLRLESQLRTYSWYDRGLPQGDELQSFVPLYEMSLICGGTADTIVEYRKVTSSRTFVGHYELISAVEVWYDRGIPHGDELQSFIPRYELSISCGVPTGAIGDYCKVTSYRALSQMRWHT